MLVLFNLFLNYISNKTETSFSKLSIRNVHKYSRTFNHSNKISWPNASLAHIKERFAKNSTVIPENASLPLNNTNVNKIRVTMPTFDTQNLSFTSFQGSTSSLLECKDPVLEDGGPITPNTTLESLDVVEAVLGPLLKPGGAFLPQDCIPKHHVAIVVPFRDRYAHLSVFLRNIHPFLMKQHIAYRIFVIEQTNGKPFNRAAMMNIGFLEALKIYPWNCFIFHDVDLLPLDDRNIYNCPHQPRHMSVSIDTLNFKLPYRTIFGGVSAMTREQFQAVNGFSNSYFGWGGEDDDMSNRLKHANLFISRYPINIARYMMLKHQKEKANPKRYENLVNGIGKMETDGINSIKYDIYSIKEFPTFTWYLAELKISNQKS